MYSFLFLVIITTDLFIGYYRIIVKSQNVAVLFFYMGGTRPHALLYFRMVLN